MTITLMIVFYDTATAATAIWFLAGIAFWASSARGLEPPAIAGWIYHEFRPFYLPTSVTAFLLVLSVGAMVGPMSGAVAVGVPKLIIDVGIWHALRNIDSDDDRWKRRRRRLAEKVAVEGGRLIVAPVGAR